MEEDDKEKQTRFVLSEKHLAELHGLLPEYKTETKEFWNFLADLPEEKLAKVFPKDFSWASVYEVSMVQHMLLLLASLGGLSIVDQVVNAGSSPVDDYIGALGSLDADDLADHWTGGDGGLFEVPDVVGLVISAAKQVNCLGTYGKYLSEFVQDVREGSEESFLKAIRIDPTILANETFAAYMARQHLRGNDGFFHLVRNGLGAKWQKPLAHFDLRVLLQAALEGGLLEKLSKIGEADRFFIQELRAYSDKGNDPARGLQRFIARWKANKFSK